MQVRDRILSNWSREEMRVGGREGERNVGIPMAYCLDAPLHNSSPEKSVVEVDPEVTVQW